MSVIPTFQVKSRSLVSQPMHLPAICQAFWIVFGVFSGMAFYGHDEGMSFTGLLLMIGAFISLWAHAFASCLRLQAFAVG